MDATGQRRAEVVGRLRELEGARDACAGDVLYAVHPMYPYVEDAIGTLIGLLADAQAAGTLTAGQVRDAVERHVGVAGDGFHSSAWQAVADELNAAVGRTCHDVTPDAAYCFTCSECGHIRRFIQGWDANADMPQDEIRFCPNCGAGVVEPGRVIR